MKRIVFITGYIVIGASFFLTGCSNRTSDYVYVIERTNTYHKKSCAPVNMAKTVMMTETKARQLHYHPCPACEHDKNGE